MTCAHALALTDRQLRLVERYASNLKVHDRDAYLRFISHNLCCGECSDSALMVAINNSLDRLSAIKNGKGVANG
jgi:hypothetical protein